MDNVDNTPAEATSSSTPTPTPTADQQQPSATLTGEKKKPTVTSLFDVPLYDPDKIERNEKIDNAENKIKVDAKG